MQAMTLEGQRVLVLEYEVRDGNCHVTYTGWSKPSGMSWGSAGREGKITKTQLGGASAVVGDSLLPNLQLAATSTAERFGCDQWIIVHERY